MSGSPPLPPTSLIIGSRNRPGLLAETVESILRGHVVPTEIIVVDQSDAPHPTLGLPRSEGPCELRYLRCSTVGPSRARNEGVRAARHELMVFTDDDVHVAPDWFETLVRAAMRDGPGVVVTGRVLPSGKGEGKGFVPSVMVDTNPALYRGRIGEDIIYPHNLAVHRSAWQAAGPFDPRLGPGSRFPAAEDNDWCYRLLEAGYQIRYLPEAVVHHRAWRTRRHYLPLRWAYGKGQGAYYAKHMSWRDGYMARRLVRESEARMVRTLRRWRQPLGALGEVVYLAGLWSGTLLWLLAERRRA